MKAFFSIALVAVATCSLCLTSFAREWKSADGKYTIEAEFVSSDGTSVKLKVKDGAEIAVPLAKLSKTDQEFVAEKVTRPAPVAGSEDDLKKSFEELGVRVGSISLSHEDESKLSSMFSQLDKSKRELFKANKQLAGVELQMQRLKQGIIQLKQLNVQLNARLTAINPTNFAENNRLVGALNANETQISLLYDQEEAMEKTLRTTRGATNEVREAYVEQVLAMRKLANEIEEKMTALAKDDKARALLASLNSATGKEFTFESRTFASSLRKLQSLEDTILSETIKMRREPSGTHYVSVVIDGEKTVEMAVDSGSSLVCFPSKMAADLGIEINSGAETIILVLADGRQIEAKKVTIDKIRVGKFTVENVEAAVLGPEAIRAEPLLGMSFLDQFKFEIDSQQSTLSMVKIESP